MKIQKKTRICGNVMFVSKSRYKDKKEKRRRRSHISKTSHNQQERNKRMAEKKLIMLLQTYFSICGLHLVLTYKDSCCPESIEAAKKELENFLRRLRYAYNKLGVELKYIQVTEYKKKRIHHHIIINGVAALPVSYIQDKIWKNGLIRNMPLENNGYYEKLAAYLIKETSKTFNTTERIFGKRYTASRNIKLPEAQEEIITGTEADITDIPLTDTHGNYSYSLIKDSEYIGIDEYTGYAYSEYAMLVTQETNTAKADRSKNAKSQSIENLADKQNRGGSSSNIKHSRRRQN